MKTLLEIGARYPVLAKHLTKNGTYDFGYFVECDPYSIPTIFQTLESSNISEDKYAVICMAIAGHNENVTIFERRRSFGNLKNYNELEVNKERTLLQSIYVSCISLDNLIDLFEMKPDLIRINVEGAEVEIIANYSFFHKPQFFEIDTHIENKKICSDILESRGYKVRNSIYNDWDIYATLTYENNYR